MASPAPSVLTLKMRACDLGPSREALLDFDLENSNFVEP